MSWLLKIREDPVVARLAEPPDRPALADLQVRGWRRHGVVAIEDQVALLNSGVSAIAFARDRSSRERSVGERAVGFLGLHLREPGGGEQWVDASMVVLAPGIPAAKTLGALLGVVRPMLAERGAKGIVCLTVENWLREAAAEAGFIEIDQVITYVRGAQAPLPGIKAVAALRRAGPAEAGTVLKLNAAAFSPLWRYDSATMLSWLFTADHAVLAETDDRPVGFALTTSASAKGYDQLIRLAIHPQAQGRGIGRQLVVDAIAYAQSTGAPGLALNTQLSNSVSRRLYEGLDFRMTGAPVRVLVHELNGQGADEH